MSDKIAAINKKAKLQQLELFNKYLKTFKTDSRESIFIREAIKKLENSQSLQN